VELIASPLAAAGSGQAGQERSGTRRTVAEDVVLGTGGVFAGSILDAGGVGIPQARLVLGRGPEVVASTATGPDGAFSFRGLPSGTYWLSAAGENRIVRLWNVASAPPSATRFALLVVSDQVLRGQGPHHGYGVGGHVRRGRVQPVSRSLYDMFEEHPVLSYTALTAAVVVPIVLISGDDDVTD
jgi:hypothetical protein